MALNNLLRRSPGEGFFERRIEPRLGLTRRAPASEVFDAGYKTVVDCAHVRVDRLDTRPVLFSKVFKEFEDPRGQKYDYRYWAERENYFLREFLKKQNEFTHVVQARHLISENEAAKQVLTCDAGITVGNWLRVKARYADTETLSHPFQRSDAFLHLLRACLVALQQLHRNRIVHCDIKEDNICIPYAPQPFAGADGRISIDYGRLKLIDFAFSVAHAIPLTQILVINPEERVPYQSSLLIAALHADRRSGVPNAVQQLDYRVDLFSLGYMAEKISAAGLDGPPGDVEGVALLEIRKLVQRLKAYDAEPAGPLPHDELIAEVDRLLALSAGPEAGRTQDFLVDGEWSTQDMAGGEGPTRKTPSTPVALPPPTPVSLPVAPAQAQITAARRTRIGLVLGAAIGIAAGAAVLYGVGDSVLAPAPARAAVEAKVPDKPPVPAKPSVPATESAAVQAGAVLESSDSREARGQALERLLALAQAGDKVAAQRIAAFEKSYDETKLKVARSAWWTRGEGTQPEAAARWLDSGSLLAQAGDRPAMLDVAFAMGHGRARKQDRASSATIYLNLIERTRGADESSARIRNAAVRGLASLLNTIVVQRDAEGAQGVLPLLQPRAEAGAADLQYYSGLLSECALQPADLDAARAWYGKAATDGAWKRTAEEKARLLGRWCPRPATAS